MCTIGAVLNPKGTHSFKQCDLPRKTLFYEPEIRTGNIGKYIAFTREDRPGIWAGINEKGVSFAAADAYTKKLFKISHIQTDRLFREYEIILSKSKTASEATNKLKIYYRDFFPAPDIIQFSDTKGSLLTEFLPPDNFHTEVINDGFLLSTNHFQFLPGAISESENQSTYKRLNRTKIILNDNPTINGIFNVLKDHTEKESEQSICRIAQKEGEYFTQAAVVFSADENIITAQYVLNANPVTERFKIISLPYVR